MDAPAKLRPVPQGAWVVAFLLFPTGPFIALGVSRAISVTEATLGCVASLIGHIGIVSVLGETNGTQFKMLQFFVLLVANLTFFTLGFWQFWAGQRNGYWSSDALHRWRVVGRFYGTLLCIFLAISVVLFHLDRALNK